MRAVGYFLIGLLIAAAMAGSVALVIRNLPDGAEPATQEAAAPADKDKAAVPDKFETAPPVAVAPPAAAVPETPPVAAEPPPTAPRQNAMPGLVTDPLAIPPAGTLEPVPPQRQASLPPPARLTLTNEQEERLRYVLLSHNIMQTEAADFPLQLDGTVPDSVPLTPLPIEVADIVPNFRAYSYVILQNRIAIVVTERRRIGLLISL